MPFAVTDPEPYVLAQVFAYQHANSLFDNDRDVRDSFDIEHDYTDGSHDTPKVPTCVGLFAWNGSVVSKVWGIGWDAGTPITRTSNGLWTLFFLAAFATQDFVWRLSGSGLYESGAVAERGNSPICTGAYISTDKDRLQVNIESAAGGAKDPHYISALVQGA